MKQCVGGAAGQDNKSEEMISGKEQQELKTIILERDKPMMDHNFAEEEATA